MFKTKPGPPVNITNELENGKPWFDSAEEIMLLREDNTLTACFYKFGIVLTATIKSVWKDEYYMNFEIQVPETFAGRTRGFFGNLDGVYSNDLYRRWETTPLTSFKDHDILEPMSTCKWLYLHRLPITITCLQPLVTLINRLWANRCQFSCVIIICDVG